MRTQLFLSFLWLSFLTCALPLSAQKKSNKNIVTQGSVSYSLEMSGANALGDQGGMMAEMMKTSEFDLYFDEHRLQYELEVGGGAFASMQVFIDATAAYTMFLAIPLAQQKFAVSPSKEELEQMKNDAPASAAGLDLVVDKKSKKKIAGYKCHKATLDLGEGKMVIYLTDAIKLSQAFALPGNQMPAFDGFPLGFEIRFQGMSLTLTANEVKKGKLPTNFFEFPEGYEMLNWEEFQKKMSGEIGDGGIGL